MLQCPNCGLVWMSPRLSSDELMKQFYSKDDYFFSEKGKNYFLRDELRIRLFKDYIIKLESILNGGKLLDVGCGLGTFLKLLDYKWEKFALDISKSSINYLINKGISGICGNILNISINEKFDAITLWDLIEHVEDPNLAIKKISNLIKPGGILLVETPDEKGLVTNIFKFLYKISFGKIKFVNTLYSAHIYAFSIKTIGIILNNNGFKIIESNKTESNINNNPPKNLGMKLLLNIIFFIARLINKENKFVVLAKKMD